MDIGSVGSILFRTIGAPENIHALPVIRACRICSSNCGLGIAIFVADASCLFVLFDVDHAAHALRLLGVSARDLLTHHRLAEQR
jgi:hypothetical protein